MTWHALVLFAPLVVMLALAAAIDIRSRRIPNALTGLLALTGLMQSFTAGHTVSPWQSVLGLLTGLATVKLFAVSLGILLHLRRVHMLVAMLNAIYLAVAIVPWAALLVSSP